MSEYIIRTTNMPEHVREALSAWYEVNEEIVRCRDCKLCDERYGRMLCRRDMSCDEIAIDVKLDGYCAWGERREDQ